MKQLLLCATALVLALLAGPASAERIQLKQYFDLDCKIEGPVVECLNATTCEDEVYACFEKYDCELNPYFPFTPYLQSTEAPVVAKKLRETKRKAHRHNKH